MTGPRITPPRDVDAVVWNPLTGLWPPTPGAAAGHITYWIGPYAPAGMGANDLYREYGSSVFFDSRTDGWGLGLEGTNPTFAKLTATNDGEYIWTNGPIHHYVESLITESATTEGSGYNALKLTARRVVEATGLSYSQSGTTVTVTDTAHGYTNTDYDGGSRPPRFMFRPTSGGLAARSAEINVTGTNTYTFVAHDSATRSGALDVYRAEAGAATTRPQNTGNGAGTGILCPPTNVTISAKIKVDPTHGTWPALWAIIQPGGFNEGELDFFEPFFAEDGDNTWRMSILRLPPVQTTMKKSHPDFTTGANNGWHTIRVDIANNGDDTATFTYYVDGILAPFDEGATGDTWTADNTNGWMDMDGWEWRVNHAIGGNWIGDPALYTYDGYTQGDPAASNRTNIGGVGAVTDWANGVEPVLEVDWFRIESLQPPIPQPAFSWSSAIAQGITDGAVVAPGTLNGFSGSDYWIPTSNMTYEDGVGVHGGIRAERTASSSGTWVRWRDDSRTDDVMYGRFYFRPEVLASSSDYACWEMYLDGNATSTPDATLYLVSDGTPTYTLYIRQQTSGTGQVSLGTVTLNTDYRLEFEWDGPTDTLTFRKYLGNDATPTTTASKTITLGTNNYFTRTSWGVGWGSVAGPRNVTWDHALSADTWIGATGRVSPAGVASRVFHLVTDKATYSGGAMTAWTDEVAAGTITAGAWPAEGATVNGYTAADFIPNDYVITPAFQSGNLTELTVALVAKCDNTTDNNLLSNDATGYQGDMLIGNDPSYTGNVYPNRMGVAAHCQAAPIEYGIINDSATDTTATHLWVARFSLTAGELSFWQDGVKQTITGGVVSGDFIADRVWNLGRNNAYNERFFNGQMLELCWWEQAVSDAEIGQLWTHFATKYGLA